MRLEVWFARRWEKNNLLYIHQFAKVPFFPTGKDCPDISPGTEIRAEFAAILADHSLLSMLQ
jgi:hypothetical protein